MNVGNSEMKYAMGCRDAYSSIFPILLSIELDGSIRRLEKRKEIQVFPVCQTLYVASVTLITVSSKLTSTSNQSHKTVLMTVHDAAGLHKIKVFESGNASFKWCLETMTSSGAVPASLEYQQTAVFQSSLSKKTYYH